MSAVAAAAADDGGLRFRRQYLMNTENTPRSDKFFRSMSENRWNVPSRRLGSARLCEPFNG